MIIKQYELKKNLRKDINIFLFYGQNTGLINEIIDKDIKTSFSKNLYNYNETEILSDRNNFETSLFNKSFFENDKLIIISHVTDKLLEIIKDIIKSNEKDFKIILKSGILEKRSKLRSFFEKSSDLIIVPFYEDNYQTLLNLTQTYFKENDIKISTQNINYILEKIKGNRLNLKNELKKIKSFSHNKSAIEFNDILKLINSSENYKISELTDHCLAKNKRKTINILNENSSSMEENILILKSFLNKLKRLQVLKKEIEKNKNQDQVISSYKPTIFWKDKEIVKKQLNTLSIREIKLFIKKVNELELTIKKNSNISSEITNNFIFEIIATSSSSSSI